MEINSRIRETKETSENLSGRQVLNIKASHKCYVPSIPVFRILQQKSLSFLQKLVGKLLLVGCTLPN